MAAEQLEQSGGADLAREQPAGNVVGGVLAPVGAEPSGDRVDVDAERTENLLGHAGASLLVGLSAANRTMGAAIAELTVMPTLPHPSADCEGSAVSAVTATACQL